MDDHTDKEIIVGIIGWCSAYGQWLKWIFQRKLGCTVIGADILDPNGLSNEEVVVKADVVVFCVPPRVTLSVIMSLVHLSREDQLWMDITSFKVAPMRAMLESRAEVVGFHPMKNAPKEGQTLVGQILVRCVGRLKRWQCLADRFVTATEATVKDRSPEGHDWQMAVIQLLTHFLELVKAKTLRLLNIDLAETLELASPVYEVSLMPCCRILSQRDPLYADIQMLNPYRWRVLAACLWSVITMTIIVLTKNRGAFAAAFAASRDHLGVSTMKHANVRFDSYLDAAALLNSPHRLDLFVRTSRPGNLYSVLQLFAEGNVNIKMLEAKEVSGGARFSIVTDGSHDGAIERISRDLVRQGIIVQT